MTITNNTINTYMVREGIIKKLQARFEEFKPSKYQQFKRSTVQGFVSYECPSCKQIFGLPARDLEKTGESSYLHPYSCPYCTKSYTIKD